MHGVYHGGQTSSVRWTASDTTAAYSLRLPLGRARVMGALNGGERFTWLSPNSARPGGHVAEDNECEVPERHPAGTRARHF